MIKALLFCGGPFPCKERMKTYIEGFDLIVAVDSGYKHALAMGVKPHVLLGDMDSLEESLVKSAKAEGVNVIPYSPVKDMTDTHLAVQYALEQGCTVIRMVGALGQRMDHTLSNMSLLKWIYEKGATGEIVDPYNEITYLKTEASIIERQGATLSVVPIAELKGLSIDGVAYPLKDRQVPYASSLCVSNVITESLARVTLIEGEAFLMISRDAEDPA